MDRTNASNDIDLKIQEREIQGYFNSKHVQTKHLRINVSAAIKKKLIISIPEFRKKTSLALKKKSVKFEKDDFNLMRVLSFTAILANIDNHNEGERRKKTCNEQHIFPY